MGLAVGPVVTGVLADRWGLTTALATVASAGLAAGFAFWWGSRYYGRDRMRDRARALPMPTTAVQTLSGIEVPDDPCRLR